MLYKDEKELNAKLASKYATTSCATCASDTSYSITADVAVGTSSWASDAIITTTDCYANTSITTKTWDSNDAVKTIEDTIAEAFKKSWDERAEQYFGNWSFGRQGSSAKGWYDNAQINWSYPVFNPNVTSCFTLTTDGGMSIVTGRKYHIKVDCYYVKVAKVNFKKRYRINIH